MYKLLKVLGLTAVCIGCSVKADAGESGSLEIQLQGVLGNAGRVILAVYDNQLAFDQNADALLSFSLPARDQTITVSDFPQTKIAVAAFHDENDNGRYDMRDDIPLEGWGNSGNLSRWSQPTFSAAVVKSGLVTVKMHFLDEPE